MVGLEDLETHRIVWIQRLDWRLLHHNQLSFLLILHLVRISYDLLVRKGRVVRNRNLSFLSRISPWYNLGIIFCHIGASYIRVGVMAQVVIALDL